MSYAIEIDAAEVLGVPVSASLQDIHDAYRARAKKHHPDAGGDDWAFRAVARAYEILSHARILSRIDAEPVVPATDLVPTSASPRRDTSFYDQDDSAPDEVPLTAPEIASGMFRAGVEDPMNDPGRVVDIEQFTIRYEFEGAAFNFLGGPENRNLSSCLHVTWPAPPIHDGDPVLPADPEVLKRLVRVFDRTPRRTKATSSFSDTKDGRFVGWLSYPTANRAFEAFEVFHQALNDAGLGVRQSSRELFVGRAGC